MESTDKNAKPARNNYMGYFLYQRADTYTSDLVRSLVFISSILVGFLFTVVSDLVISLQDTNDLILTIIFSSLMVSSLSLFASIIFGALFQYLFNIGAREQLHNTEQFDPKQTVETPKYSMDEFDEILDKEIRPLARFVLGGSAPVLLSFLIGVFFFIISFILIGWIHSSTFVLIAFVLSIGLGIIFLYGGYKTISLYHAYKKTRSDK